MLIRYPASLLGVKELWQRHLLIVGMVRALRAVKCPHCAKGVFERKQQTNIVDEARDGRLQSEPLYIWRCNHCRHYVYAGETNSHLIDAMQEEAARIRRSQALNITPEERAFVMIRWRDSSRLWYGAAATVFWLGALWVLWNGSLNVAFFQFWVFATLYTFMMGMKGAYRFWQAQTDTLFERGAFKRWFMNGAWFV